MSFGAAHCRFPHEGGDWFRQSVPISRRVHYGSTSYVSAQSFQRSASCFGFQDRDSPSAMPGLSDTSATVQPERSPLTRLFPHSDWRTLHSPFREHHAPDEHNGCQCCQRGDRLEQDARLSAHRAIFPRTSSTTKFVPWRGRRRKPDHAAAASVPSSSHSSSHPKANSGRRCLRPAPFSRNQRRL